MKITSAIKHKDEFLVSFEDNVERRRPVEVMIGNKPIDETSLFDYSEYDESMKMDVPDDIKDRFSFAEVTHCYNYDGKIYTYCVLPKLNEKVFNVWLEEYATENSHIESF